MQDVARRAGVALGTVSNVLNRPEKVADSTKKRVHKAIRELGFVRNSAARSLVTGTTRTVGIVLTNASNALFVEIARGAEAQLAAAGHPALWANSDVSLARQSDYLRMFDEDRVAGIILAPLDGPLDAAREVKSHGRPVILVNAPDQEPGTCCVSSDEIDGGYQAAIHLIDSGAARLAFIGDFEHLRAPGQRLVGAERAAAERGVPLQRIATERQNAAEGLLQASQILQHPERPDGVICASDRLAVGVMQAATELGIQVPDQLRVIGYDNNVLAADSPISISTVSQLGREMGQVAAGLLLDEIRDPERHEHQHVVLKPKLIPRRSSSSTL